MIQREIKMREIMYMLHGKGNLNICPACHVDRSRNSCLSSGSVDWVRSIVSFMETRYEIVG